MKKTILGFILFTLLFLVGCNCESCNIFKTEVVAYTNEILLTYDSDLSGHLKYNEEDIPTYKIKFDGTVNITKQRTGEYECIFSHNDDFFVSNIIKSIITEYEEKNRVSYYVMSKDNESETWMNHRDENVDEKIYIKVKDGVVYNELAYITLENGLQLTINYARFVNSETNETYYRWQKTESIRIFLHYPLMVIDDNDERKFVFIAVPNQVTLKFDTTTKQVKDLLEKDKFTTEEWYTYSYQTSYEKDYDNYVKYYVDNFDGYWENDLLYYSFLGEKFNIKFNEDNFIITYVK